LIPIVHTSSSSLVVVCKRMPLPEQEGSHTINLTTSSVFSSIPGTFDSMKSRFKHSIWCSLPKIAFETLLFRMPARLVSRSNAYTLSQSSPSYNVLFPGDDVASIPTIFKCLFLFLKRFISRSSFKALPRISTGIQLERS